MKKITIVPIGVKANITMLAFTTIRDCKSGLYFLTLEHPSVTWLLDALNADIHMQKSMDDLFVESADFDVLNERIADRLCNDESAEVVFAVPGRGPGNALMKAIMFMANERGINVEVLPSSGYAEAACAKARTEHLTGRIVLANEMPSSIDVYSPLMIEEIDTNMRASEVKLTLCDYYPEQTEIIFAFLDNTCDYCIRNIKLFELDRQKEYFASTVIIVRPHEFLELNRHGLEGLQEIIRRLRAPDGCPWDRKQTHETLKTPLIEEAYEVLDAIITGDIDSLIEELGDLLLQVVFHVAIEEERSEFTMRDVCSGIVNKLIYRHPHVFAQAKNINTADDVLVAWEELKKKEKSQKTQTDAMKSIPKSFPSLMRSFKAQKKASAVGFDWPTPYDALCKIREEADELDAAAKTDSADAIEDEMGDLLFSVVNVSRLFGVDPEIALGAATDKFIARFSKMEELATESGLSLEKMSLEEMDKLWECVKCSE